SPISTFPPPPKAKAVGKAGNGPAGASRLQSRPSQSHNPCSSVGLWGPCPFTLVLLTAWTRARSPKGLTAPRRNSNVMPEGRALSECAASQARNKPVLSREGLSGSLLAVFQQVRRDPDMHRSVCPWALKAYREAFVPPGGASSQTSRGLQDGGVKAQS